MNEKILGGPIAEPAESDFWKSGLGKSGGHYNVFEVDHKRSMEALRRLFPHGKADPLNFVLFSTSGVHGSYTTIESAEIPEHDDDEDYGPPTVTFLVVHPRLVCLRYGNCTPRTADDFEFLKALRESSWEVIQQIGRHDPAPQKWILPVNQMKLSFEVEVNSSLQDSLRQLQEAKLKIAARVKEAVEEICREVEAEGVMPLITVETHPEGIYGGHSRRVNAGVTVDLKLPGNYLVPGLSR